jgi:SAM-dependent methyltransferase
MDMAERTYRFSDVSACVMCCEPAGRSHVMGLRLSRSQGVSPRNKTGVAVSVCRCQTCGLIYSNPRPEPISIEDHYGIPPEDYFDESYFTNDAGYFARQIAQAKKLLAFCDGMRALDIGIGFGKGVSSMQAAGFDVYGIEPSKPFYDKAIEFHNLTKDKMKLTSVEVADFPDSNFDFVTFGAVLEHVYNPAVALERALKWAKPGGIVHLEVPNSNHLISKIINSYYRLIGTNVVTNISPMLVPFHLY